MNKLYLIIAAISVFFAGWFSGKGYSDNAWHKINEQQLQLYNQKLTDKIQVNNKLAESYNQLNTKYLVSLQDKQNALKQNQELINHNNRITKQLVQYIQGSDSRDRLQEDNTKLPASADATIPAVDFGVWAAGLVTHDQQCVNQLNTLIRMVSNAN